MHCKAFSFFLLGIILLETFSAGATVIRFYGLEQSSLLERCINKNKEDVCCQARCQLQQQLQEQENPSTDEAVVEMHQLEYTDQSIRLELPPIKESPYVRVNNFAYDQGHYLGFFPEILPPPPQKIG